MRAAEVHRLCLAGVGAFGGDSSLNSPKGGPNPFDFMIQRNAVDFCVLLQILQKIYKLIVTFADCQHRVP